MICSLLKKIIMSNRRHCCGNLVCSSRNYLVTRVMKSFSLYYECFNNVGKKWYITLYYAKNNHGCGYYELSWG